MSKDFKLNALVILLILFFFITNFSIYNGLGYYSDDPWWFFSKRFYGYEGLPITEYIARSFEVHRGYHVNRYLFAVFKELFMLQNFSVISTFKILNFINFFINTLNIYLLFKYLKKLNISIISIIIGTLIFISYPIIGEIKYWPTSLTPYSPSLTILLIYFLKDGLTNKKHFLDCGLLFLSIFIYEQLFFTLLFINFYKYYHHKNILFAFILSIIGLLSFIVVKFFLSNFGHSPNLSLTDLIANVSKILIIFSFPEYYAQYIDLKLFILKNKFLFSFIIIFFIIFIFIGIFINNNNDKRKDSDTKQIFFLILVLFSSYAGNLVWDLSPRHNYISLAIFSILISLVVNSLEINKDKIQHLALILIFGLKLSYLYCLNINEGQEWKKTYKARMQMYEKVYEYGYANNLNEIKIINLPSKFDKIPLFAYENLSNFHYIYFNQSNIKILYIDPFDKTGYHFDLVNPFTFPPDVELNEINSLKFKKIKLKDDGEFEIVLENLFGEEF